MNDLISPEKMGLGETALVWLLKAFTFVYDVITLPIYAALQQPWVRRRAHKEPKVSVNEAITRSP